MPLPCQPTVNCDHRQDRLHDLNAYIPLFLPIHLGGGIKTCNDVVLISYIQKQGQLHSLQATLITQNSTKVTMLTQRLCPSNTCSSFCRHLINSHLVIPAAMLNTYMTKASDKIRTKLDCNHTALSICHAGNKKTNYSNQSEQKVNKQHWTRQCICNAY